MWGYGAPDDDTIASALTRALAQAGVGARITNFGQFGYVSTQDTILFFEQLRGGQIPDIAIFYDGFNDTASAFQNGVAGISENEANRAREFNALNGEIPAKRRALYNYALGMFVGNLAIVRIARSALRRLCSACLGPRNWQTADWINFSEHPAQRTQTLSTAVVNAYLANIRLIEQAGRHLGCRTIFYWQPALYGRKHPSAFERKQMRDYVPGEEQFFLATWSAARQAANDPALPAGQRPVYLQDVLPQDMPCFIDTAHISGACNEVVGRRIAADVTHLIALAHLSSPAAPFASKPR